ncbi:hypothetical protein Mahau_2500 [Mahella australiensis 50-1 BON]|uniref:Uncharacterized protein n=1 Tax=Mahella australiensis (strain DSM 15567 / CIP 107919 / 50-1 BON) TaxID=697281 RepID=F3ZXH6_MAHA5|nr:hypothetical protein Mahau_2500 [Mahella australiensis 50-1 BON]
MHTYQEIFKVVNEKCEGELAVITKKVFGCYRNVTTDLLPERG